MQILTVTCFLSGQIEEWVGEISFPAPKGPKAIWPRVFEVLHAIGRKCDDFRPGQTVNVGLYLELDELSKTERCRQGFWDLMMNCHNPTSITWRKSATQPTEGGTCHEA